MSTELEQPTSAGKVDVATLFPTSIGAARRGRRWRGAGRVAVIGVVAAALVAGVLAVRASGSATSYRTATADRREVDAVLDGVGTIEPVTQAAVAFPVAGTVASVDVTVGATVAAGQQLATLDVTELTAALHEQQAALADAQLVLQRALDGEAVARSFGTAALPMDAMLLASTTSSAQDQLRAAQQAVLAAQQDVDAAMARSATALASATSVCAAIGVDASDPTAALASINGCRTALEAVVAAQQQVSAAQATLADAAKALDDLLAQLADDAANPTTTTTVPSPTTTQPTDPSSTTTTEPTDPSATSTTPSPPASSTPPSSAPTGGTGGRGSGGSGFTGGSGGSNGSVGASPSGGGGSSSSASASASPSSEDLVAYQRAVDAAAADVTVAEQALAQATVVSPIAGTVVAVNLSVGETATAASTTQTIVVQGAGGFEATTTVSLVDVPDVKVGQQATVLADGATEPVTGTVVSVSSIPSTSSTTPSYGVVVSLPPEAEATLRNGAIGTVGIVTGTASGVAVPTSAVKTVGGRHVVEVVDGSTTREVVVQVGVVGDTWTQLTGGLQAGQEVVLATVSDPLPSSATATSIPQDTGIRFGPNGRNGPFVARP